MSVPKWLYVFPKLETSIKNSRNLILDLVIGYINCEIIACLILFVSVDFCHIDLNFMRDSYKILDFSRTEI